MRREREREREKGGGREGAMRVGKDKRMKKERES
jgi:hypothetical protein